MCFGIHSNTWGVAPAEGTVTDTVGRRAITLRGKTPIQSTLKNSLCGCNSVPLGRLNHAIDSPDILEDAFSHIVLHDIEGHLDTACDGMAV